MHAPSDIIHEWLERRILQDNLAWLDGQLEKLRGAGSERDLIITFGLIPRRLGKADLDLTADEMTAASKARTGWDPSRWTVETAARVLAMLAVAQDEAAFLKAFHEFCRSADVAEAIALYSGLPLYPAPETLQDQAAEGLRGNVRAVFEAVAHCNPYPREQFDENRWNHMVLKALFIGATLASIQGIDERANPVLARIMCDYAHERWAAGRQITPEIWRCVGPFAEGDMIADLERVASSTDPSERAAAALALTANPSPQAKAILETLADEARKIGAGTLHWDDVLTA
jgi:hypothetical protein